MLMIYFQNEKGLLKKEREEGKCITLTNGTKLWATILPEDVIIALLSERLMVGASDE